MLSSNKTEDILEQVSLPKLDYPLQQVLVNKSQLMMLVRLSYAQGVTDICDSLRSPRLGTLGGTIAEYLEHTFHDQEEQNRE